MTAPLGMSDFFALEAGKYLDRLDALLQPPAPPAAEELVRLAARVTRQRPDGEPAGDRARGDGTRGPFFPRVREGRRPWDAATKQIADSRGR